MKNKKFWLIMLVFTVAVPGFMVFSYWYLGVFSILHSETVENVAFIVVGGRVSGDYQKTGVEVVKTKRILLDHGFTCEPILVYFDNAITTGKAYLRSLGGCRLPADTPQQLQANFLSQNREKLQIKMRRALRLTIHAQTAVALRKVWREIARLSEQGTKLNFPLLQRARADGESEFFIALEQ